MWFIIIILWCNRNIVAFYIIYYVETNICGNVTSNTLYKINDRASLIDFNKLGKPPLPPPPGHDNCNDTIIIIIIIACALYAFPVVL